MLTDDVENTSIYNFKIDLTLQSDVAVDQEAPEVEMDESGLTFEGLSMSDFDDDEKQ